jgi:hypothetical protein
MTNLGQELDRWQLIARDLIELVAEYSNNVLPEFEFSIYEELKAMPEMHANKTFTEYKESF